MPIHAQFLPLTVHRRWTTALCSSHFPCAIYTAPPGECVKASLEPHFGLNVARRGRSNTRPAHRWRPEAWRSLMTAIAPRIGPRRLRAAVRPARISARRIIRELAPMRGNRPRTRVAAERPDAGTGWPIRPLTCPEVTLKRINIRGQLLALATFVESRPVPARAVAGSCAPSAATARSTTDTRWAYSPVRTTCSKSPLLAYSQGTKRMPRRHQHPIDRTVHCLRVGVSTRTAAAAARKFSYRQRVHRRTTPPVPWRHPAIIVSRQNLPPPSTRSVIAPLSWLRATKTQGQQAQIRPAGS